MSAAGRGIVLLNGSGIAWFGCFDCGQQLKARTMTRRWNPQQKCWQLDISELYTAWSVLKAHHREAQVVDENGTVQPEPQPRKTQGSWWQEEFDRKIRDRQRREQQAGAPRSAPGSGLSWADQMFASVPEALHGELFKSLLHVLHPDKNGHSESCRLLLEARERWRGQDRPASLLSPVFSACVRGSSRCTVSPAGEQSGPVSHPDSCISARQSPFLLYEENSCLRSRRPTPKRSRSSSCARWRSGRSKWISKA